MTYCTPGYEKTNVSPEKEGYVNNRKKVEGVREEGLGGQLSHRRSQELEVGNLTALLGSNINKSASNLKSYYDPPLT